MRARTGLSLTRFPLQRPRIVKAIRTAIAGRYFPVTGSQWGFGNVFRVNSCYHFAVGSNAQPWGQQEFIEQYRHFRVYRVDFEVTYHPAATVLASDFLNDPVMMIICGRDVVGTEEINYGIPFIRGSAGTAKNIRSYTNFGALDMALKSNQFLWPGTVYMKSINLGAYPTAGYQARPTVIRGRLSIPKFTEETVSFKEWLADQAWEGDLTPTAEADPAKQVFLSVNVFGRADRDVNNEPIFRNPPGYITVKLRQYSYWTDPRHGGYDDVPVDLVEPPP